MAPKMAPPTSTLSALYLQSPSPPAPDKPNKSPPSVKAKPAPAEKPKGKTSNASPTVVPSSLSAHGLLATFEDPPCAKKGAPTTQTANTHNALPSGFAPIPTKWSPGAHRGSRVWVHGYGYGTVMAGTMAWPRVKLDDLVAQYGVKAGPTQTCRDVLASLVFIST